MRKQSYFSSAFFLSIVLILFSCNNPKQEEQKTPIVNLDHLMHLYDTILLPGGIDAGIVHIYSEYPNYSYEIEPNEGYTCVDDVARSLMIDQLRLSKDEALQEKYERMIRFLLFMQADNGWFHNFIWHDLSINKTWRTSLAEPNWWSWRAFWALASYNGNNPQLKDSIHKACDILSSNIYKTYLNSNFDMDNIQGVAVPNWLPLGTAGDQAALLIMGLEAYYKNINQDERALLTIDKLAKGILLTQKGDATNFPYGAFMSFENGWHAYGNMQAFAMLRAGQLLGSDDYTQAALNEINNFYPWLVEQNYLANFVITKKDNAFEMVKKEQFSQIAYGFRPMIWACVEAAQITGEQKYTDQAYALATWFTGNNPANTAMYDQTTGRCFDGIVSETKVNLNSGAESTIEALLSLQVLNTQCQ